MSLTLSTIKKIYSSVPLNKLNVINIHNQIKNSYTQNTFNNIFESNKLNKLNNKIDILRNNTNIYKIEINIIQEKDVIISNFPGYISLLQGNINIKSNNFNMKLDNGSIFLDSSHIISNKNKNNCSVILCHYDTISYPKYIPLI